MKVLVTGAKGFIGKNLIATLETMNDIIVFPCDVDTKEEVLKEYLRSCEYIYHLAGINRPKNEEEFLLGNYGYTLKILKVLEENKNKCPIMLASSIQTALSNPYGISKHKGEEVLKEYAQKNCIKIFIYRFPNVFGKWCRPNYNSVIATFCYNIARGKEIHIHDSGTCLDLVYIDDVINELVATLKGGGNKKKDGYCYVEPVYRKNLGEIADLLHQFYDVRKTLDVPDTANDGFSKKLYSTYLSYLPEDDFKYSLIMHKDNRGSFTEVFRTKERGQFSVNVIKPGIEKGNHWHHTKNEKFIVVSGKGLIKFRALNSDDIIHYHVSGDVMEVVDIPVGYTHSILNEGNTDMVVLMWCNECFDEGHPDTYYLQVNQNR